MSKTKEDKKIKFNNKEENTKKTSKKVLIFTVIILLLVTMGIIIFFLLKNYNNNEGKDNNMSENEQSEKIEQEGESLIDYENMDNVELIDGKKKNNSKALLEEKIFKGLNVKEINLQEINGVTSFTAKLENNTDEDFKNCIIVIIFTNEDKSEYARLEASIPDIPKGKSTILDASTTSDLTNAFDFKIEEF